jgi:hypothetical protein
LKRIFFEWNKCLWFWSINNILLWNCYAKMNRNLVGSTYGRFFIKFPQSRMKGERHRLSPLSL